MASLKCIGKLILELHPGFNPLEVRKAAHILLWWYCKRCGHGVQKKPAEMEKYEGCTHCTKGSNAACCGDEECMICWKRSFANTPHAKNWMHEKNGDLKPHHLRANSNKPAWNLCGVCEHPTFRSPNEILAKVGCCHCTQGQGRVCDDEACKRCFERSFASHPRSIHWDYSQNDKTPRQVTAFTSDKYKFICDICLKTYETSPKSVSSGYWCGCQKNKTEAKLYDWLLQQDSGWKRQLELPNLRKRYMDFYHEDKKLIIELDGEQHFQQVSNWNPADETRRMDILKMDKAFELRYRVIRITQDDVYHDKNEWKQKLIDAMIANKQFQFICSKNEYTQHKKSLSYFAQLHKWKCNHRSHLSEFVDLLDISLSKKMTYQKDKLIEISSKIKDHYKLKQDSPEEIVMFFMTEIMFMKIEMLVKQDTITYIPDSENSIMQLI